MAYKQQKFLSVLDTGSPGSGFWYGWGFGEDPLLICKLCSYGEEPSEDTFIKMSEPIHKNHTCDLMTPKGLNFKYNHR